MEYEVYLLILHSAKSQQIQVTTKYPPSSMPTPDVEQPAAPYALSIRIDAALDDYHMIHFPRHPKDSNTMPSTYLESGTVWSAIRLLLYLLAEIIPGILKAGPSEAYAHSLLSAH